MTRVALDPRSLEVWEANLRVLRAVQPLLCSRLEALSAERDGLFEHAENKDEKGVWVEGLTRTPFFQSDAFPPLPWRKKEHAKGSVLFVYGTGTVPWLHVLFRSLPPGILSVVVVEPSLELLAYTLRTTAVYRLLSGDCRVSFLSPASKEETKEALDHGINSPYDLSRLALYCHPGETALWPGDFAEIQSQTASWLTSALFALGNSVEDTLLGLRQMSLLSPWIALGVRLGALKDAYSGRPFVWVASGPSLDKNFRLLKENRNRAVIVCADTAASKLLGEGIVPHIVVALERGNAVRDYTEKIYSRFPGEARRILLAAQSVCVPEAVGKWPGPAVVVGKAELSLDRWIVGEVLGGGLLVSGLSVAHMGVWLSAFLGASCAALIGQDFAFAPGRVSHAEGTANRSAMALESGGGTGRRVVQVPGALGGTVETHETWLVFLRMMESHIPTLGCGLFDCTEGGALIEGAAPLPFRKWMETRLAGVEPFGVSPAELAASLVPGAGEREARAGLVVSRADEGLRALERASAALDRAAEGTARVGAPALSPARRRALAEKAQGDLRAFYREHPVMNYIGQAAAGISVTDLRRNDALEDGPSVKEWVSSFSDIVRVCRISLRFARDSLRYIRDAVPGIARRWDEGYSLEPAPFFPAGSVRDLNGMEESLKVPEMTEALEAVRSGGPFFPLDNLIARADHKWWHFWDRRADWTIALLLERAGRSAEASFFMGRFEASELSVFGLAEGEAGAFYRDFARILSARDLCRETNWDRVAFASQKGFLPDAPPGRKRDAERMAWSLKASEGRLFFEYAPRYLVDGSRALLEDAARFAAAARYKKRQVLDFDPGAGEALRGALSTGSGDESPAGFGAEPHDLFHR